MARLELIKDNLSVLDDIERQADGYAVLNMLVNIGVQAIAIYAIDRVSLDIARALGCPC